MGGAFPTTWFVAQITRFLAYVVGVVSLCLLGTGLWGTVRTGLGLTAHGFEDRLLFGVIFLVLSVVLVLLSEAYLALYRIESYVAEGVASDDL